MSLANDLGDAVTETCRVADADLAAHLLEHRVGVAKGTDVELLRALHEWATAL